MTSARIDQGDLLTATLVTPTTKGRPVCDPFRFVCFPDPDGFAKTQNKNTKSKMKSKT